MLNVSKNRLVSLTVASIAFACPLGPANAAEIDDTTTGSAGDGFGILGNATNVTHWGLGAGVMVLRKPYQGDDASASPIPLFYFDDKWVSAIGTTLDLKLLQWHGIRVALRGRYALGDGYDSSDSSMLQGMSDRKAGFWFGPAVSWTSGLGTLSADVLTSGNKGQQVNVRFGKAFAFGPFAVVPRIAAQWTSSNYVDYYFGVRPEEATAYRPAYRGTSAINEEVGMAFAWNLTRSQRVSLDLNVRYFGSSVADSPIVGRRFVPSATVAYLYQFK
ncbi:MipA/OmpV family protein [Caballeronia sp. LZ065]|uniref:MipA/OmpV family protein n=1 Tax=Caballeronia sp. LZ065 TaxID=3038571 RepID=UPI002854C6E1|nr:MipA/OmpV family protein [Caballeronia sp. LZ065]MDR5777863.1 MipA/OmpV family protein [Caballeronia sp. LZ065]